MVFVQTKRIFPHGPCSTWFETPEIAGFGSIFPGHSGRSFSPRLGHETTHFKDLVKYFSSAHLDIPQHGLTSAQPEPALNPAETMVGNQFRDRRMWVFDLCRENGLEDAIGDGTISSFRPQKMVVNQSSCRTETRRGFGPMIQVAPEKQQMGFSWFGE